MRLKAKVDANQTMIVNTLRACGCEVESLAAVGGGVADLLVYHRAMRRVLLIEVKDGSKAPSARKLTPAQVEWHARWPVMVVENIGQAIEALRAKA